MAPTTCFTDCRRFAAAITAAGGVVPDALAHLLSAHELLSSPAATQRPEPDILTAALEGSLSAATLAKLAPTAAAAQMTQTYLRELARSSEHVLLGEWHRQMKAGGADQILGSLRERFDQHATAIATARELINPDSTAEQVIASGQSELVTAWQQLSGHIKVIAQIAHIATQFGPRGGIFPQITEYSLGENFRLTDSAIMCMSGDLEHDSAAFGRPDPMGHRDNPWFKVPLRLHSIASAKA